MSEINRKFITPLYDTILDTAIRGVFIGFSSGSSRLAWDSLLTLYDVLDENIKKECKGLIDEVERHVSMELCKKGYTVSDEISKKIALETYVGIKKHELFNKIIALLMKHKYLEGSHMPTTRTTGIEDLARRLEENRI